MSTSPGTFTFKIKSYDNEEGEYSAWQAAEPGTIIQFIMAHWFNETLPNNLDIIVIKNVTGDQLVIDHENKDVFRFFLIPAEKGIFYYYKMTDIRFMFFVLEHFFSGLMDILKENMNKTMDDFRWVKGDFLEKSFYYSFHWKKKVGLLITNVLVLCFGLVFLVYAFFVVTEILFVLLVAVVAIGTAIWNLIPDIVWYHDQKNLAITLSRGDRYIHIWAGQNKKSIPKTDISAIRQHCRLDREINLWVPTFTELEFLNGDCLNLSSLIIPQDLIREKFHQEELVFVEVHSGKRKLIRKTNLTGYFPELTRLRYTQ